MVLAEIRFKIPKTNSGLVFSFNILCTHTYLAELCVMNLTAILSHILTHLSAGVWHQFI